MAQHWRWKINGRLMGYRQTSNIQNLTALMLAIISSRTLSRPRRLSICAFETAHDSLPIDILVNDATLCFVYYNKSPRPEQSSNRRSLEINDREDRCRLLATMMNDASLDTQAGESDWRHKAWRDGAALHAPIRCPLLAVLALSKLACSPHAPTGCQRFCSPIWDLGIQNPPLLRQNPEN